MTAPHHDLLILRYFDHTASADEVAALSELIRCDAEVRLLVRDMAELAAAKGDFSRERMILSPRRGEDSLAPLRRRSGRKWWLAAACFVLMLGGIAAWAGRASQATIAITHVSGAVSFMPNGGEVLALTQPGERIPAGILRIEGMASSVELSFDDGSSITLVGDAELVVSAGEQKVLTLHEGSLSAEVRHQKPGRPMIIHTPTADIEVVGTQFTIAAEKVQTRLLVESGLVKFRRRSDGSTIDVRQGKEAVASLDTAKRMESRHEELADTFRQTFQDKPDNGDSWRGNWLPPDATNPGRMQCVTDFSSRQADGSPVAAYTISMVRRPASIAAVVPQSVLRLRFRTADRKLVFAMVGLRHATGGWAGNFTKTFVGTDGTMDEAGWQTVEVPLSTMKGTRPTVPSNAQVFLIYLAAFSSKANLELAEVSILPPETTVMPAPDRTGQTQAKWSH